MSTVRTFIKDSGLSIAFLAIFVVTLVGQSLAGFAENWQSEFLQFFLFILATIWLIQVGSPESKKSGDEGVGSDAEQRTGVHAGPDSPRWAKVRGIRLWLYSNSLLLVMGSVFVLSWLAQSLAGHVVANEENAMHGLPPESWIDYVLSPEFWNRTLQNWQSEFLAVGAMVAFSIYLRQRGSGESKPVGVPHHVSSVESD